ncbi:MAG: glutathione peroxidase [Clostridia bacterium]|nr:glutathione peroxidase [Clostridia bacterium]
MTIYDFKVNNGSGEEISLNDYRGKVLLVVNTATGCGFTPQYKGLENLYEKYSEKGFEILDFPCNQFGHQAPGTNAEITEFCQLHYATKFPQMMKIDVNGKNESPLYTWLKSQKSGVFGSNIKWNFTKFLIDREGNVVSRYAPTVTPEAIDADIEKLI